MGSATVGRDVAVKIILPLHANNPNFIRRFEAEAQLIARPEHPHIVPLYDYWREPKSRGHGRFYVATPCWRPQRHPGALTPQIPAGRITMALHLGK